MNKFASLVTGNVLRHLLAQMGAFALMGAAAYLAKVDYSALGAYAPMAQGAAALLASIVNEALGAAPKP